MSDFTLIDRMVLESLNKESRTITSLQDDTHLSINICNRVLENLITQNIIIIEKNKYSINKNISKSIISNLNSKSQINIEVKTLITQSIQSDNKEIHYYKVNMSKEERIILDTLFYNVESFIKTLKGNKGATKDETFIYWGEKNYAEAINSYIE